MGDRRRHHPRRFLTKRTRLVLVVLLALVLPGLGQPAAARSEQPGSDIIGGEAAEPGEFPFMVAVLDDGIDGSDLDKQFCGGSLINAQWVLTAGHGVRLTTTGWGTTTARGKPVYADILQKVVVPVVGDGPCQDVYKKKLDASTMVCAGEAGLDSCVGDSGGPLFGIENGVPIQVGITSWGQGCAKKRFPGVYTEVNSPQIRDWIDETIAEN